MITMAEGRSLMHKKPSSRQRRGAYEVGRDRPPLSTRWKPGQSGNPKGRPKGAKSLATIWSDAFKQLYRIRQNGKLRKITAREGVVISAINQALKGNIKATSFVLAKEPEVARSDKPIPKISSDMSAQEAMNVYLSVMRGTGEGDER
jgi:Family of unknown function (DUF5681)